MRQPQTQHPSLKSVPPADEYRALFIFFLLFLTMVAAALFGLLILIDEPSDLFPMSIIGLLVLVGAVVAGAWLLRQYRRARRLDRRGQRVAGTIVERWIEAGATDEPDAYYVAYQFGDGVRVAQKVRAREFQVLAAGMKVTVRYLPDDPTCSRMEGV